MKRFIILILAVASLSLALEGCSAQYKAQTQAQNMELVNQAEQSGEFYLYIDTMFPKRGPSQKLTSSYSVKVKDGVLHSYLPYFGQAWNVPYGGGKGLVFDAPIEQLQQGITRKGDGVVFQVLTKNEEDTYLYDITIYSTGYCSVTVQSRNRDTIRYSGHIQEMPAKENG